MHPNPITVNTMPLHFAPRSRARVLRLLLTILAALGSPSFAQQSAQSRKLDDARFIQGLREKGLKDLLVYYIQKFPPSDPVLKQEIVIEQQKLNFEDASQPPERRAQAALDVLGAYRDLFKIAPKDHGKLPIWRTDFAAYVLRIVLPARFTNAAEFVEFGVPTSDQRKAYDELVAEVYKSTEQASDEIFFIMNDLPRRPNFTTDFENTGMWDRLKTDYGDLQVPYYRAWAIYYGTLLTEPMGNRAEALSLFKGVANQDLGPGIAAELQNFIARLTLAQASSSQEPDGSAIDSAIAALKKVAATEGANPVDVLTANLAVTQGLASARREKQAVEMLAEIRKLPIVQTSPMMMILTYDRQFKITNDTGVYAKLFEEPSLKDTRDAVQSYVSRRFSSVVMSVEDLRKEAPLVVLGQVDGIFARAEAAKTPEDKAKSLADAVAVLKELLGRPDLAAPHKSKALFKLGAAEYQAGRPLEAAVYWAQLAEQHSDQPEGESAATNSFLIARNLYNDNVKNSQIIQLFDQTQITLLTKYPHTTAARQHTYTRANFLLQQRRYTDAVEAYAKVAKDHPFHADSIYETAMARHGQWLSSPADNKEKKAALAKSAITALDAAAAALVAAAKDAKPDRAASLSEKQGDALLMKAEVLNEGMGQPKQAAAILADFDQKYAKSPKLMALKRPLTVSILVAQGMMKQANDEVDRFRKESPDQAGPIIKGVLDKLSRMIEESIAKTETAKAKELSDLSITLATSLYEWAKTQKSYATPDKLLPFELILADQYLAAGQPDKAVERYEALYKAPGGAANVDVLYGKAKANLAAKRYQDALNTADTIVSNLKDQANPIYWHCWVISLQSLDGIVAQSGNKAEADKLSRSIFTSIAKLRGQNKELGGEVYKAAFEALSVKHQPK